MGRQRGCRRGNIERKIEDAENRKTERMEMINIGKKA